MTNPNTENDRTLQTLTRSLTQSPGRFSLILVRCNYTSLRDRIVAQVCKQCSIEIRQLNLFPSTKTLYTTIVNEFGEQPTDAVMVLGLESVMALDDLLGATNKVRDQFRSFPFPVVLWVTDRVLRQLMRVAPDFKSWAGPPLEFKLPNEELMGLLAQQAEQIFAEEPNFTVEGDELEAIEQDLQSSGQELEPELKASLALMKGFIQYRDNQLDAALDYYQQSLAFLQQDSTAPKAYIQSQKFDVGHVGEKHLGDNVSIQPKLNNPHASPSSDSFNPPPDNPPPNPLLGGGARVQGEGIVLLQLGLTYYRKGKQYWLESRNYLQQCLDKFEEAQRQDLVAKHINQLCQVLQGLEDWESLENRAQQALGLHQNHGNPGRLVEDYSFLAEVALKKEQWQEAKQWAKQALAILENNRNVREGNPDQDSLLPVSPSPCPRVYFQLAKSEQGLGEITKAIRNLEQAKDQTQPQHQLSLYLEILQELRSLYFEQGQYREAFYLKLEQREVESRYGLRAFVGAGRLQPVVLKREEGSQVTIAEQVEDIVAASGRQQDVERLIERVNRADCKLTVIHGQSGVGKSSILQAGLVPALEVSYFEGREAVPVFVDVYTNWLRELGKGLSEARRHGDAETRRHGNGKLGGESYLQTILQQLQQNGQRHRLTVLIFDQFEEFFFVYKDQASRRPFYEFLHHCLEISYVKIILSLREDYLHYLLELTRTTNFEGFDDNYKHILYYLGNFSPADAKSVIWNLTQRSQFYLEPELVEELVRDLAGEVEEVRPIELQIVGTQLQTTKITTLEQYQELGSEDKLVERFVEDVVKDCGKENEETAQLILYLLTDENNTRPSKNKAELTTDLVVEAQNFDLVIEILVGSRLVFRVPQFHMDRYQLVHDYLVPFIRQQRGAELLAKLERAKEEQRRTQAKLNRVLRRQLRAAVTVGAMAVLAASAVGFALRAEFQRQLAEIGQIIALSESTKVLLALNQEFDALVKGLRASRKLKQAVGVKSDTQIRVAAALQQAVYSVQERNRLEENSDEVYSVSFSPDGQFIASASADSTVKLWLHDGTFLKTLKSHREPVWDVSFSQDGQLIASASADKTIKLWRRDGTFLTTLIGHNDEVYSVSFSQDGQFIASASADKTIKLWRRDGTFLTTLIGHSEEVDSVSFSPDSQLIASTSADKTIKLWRRDGTLINTFRGHKDRVYQVSFSPDGQTVASASRDKTVKLWHKDGTLLNTLEEHTERIYSVNFSPDGQFIASASADSIVKLWRRDGTLVKNFQGHKGIVWAVSFSPDSQTIASASDDASIKLWDLDSPTVSELQRYKGIVWGISFSSDNQVIASAGEDKIVKLWRRDGTLLRTLQGHRDTILDLEFSPDSQMIASASQDHTIKLWHRDGHLLKTLIGHSSRVYSVSFSPDGQFIASASRDNTVQIWTPDGRKIKTLEGHRGPINWVSYSPDGQVIASASDDTTVKLWSRDGNLLKTLPAHIDEVFYVTFSPDGKVIASASKDKTIKLWDREGTLLKTLKGHQNAVTSISFSPDSQVIASASWDHTVKLWNRDGEELITLREHKDVVTNMSFSKDGKLLVSASRDGTLLMWNLDLDKLLVSACRWLHDYLKTNPNLPEKDRTLCNGIVN